MINKIDALEKALQKLRKKLHKSPNDAELKARVADLTEELDKEYKK